MSVKEKTLFADILAESKDGEWGKGEAEFGLEKVLIIRGTDFKKLSNPSANFPLRWVKSDLVKRKRLIAGDLILETAGGTSNESTGRSALLKDTFFQNNPDMPILCASFSRFLRLKTKEYYPTYIYYLLQSLHKSGYMAVFNIQHTGVSRFQYTSFKNKTRLDIPEFPVQQKIAAILSAYDDLIENNNKRIGLLEKAAEEIYREWFVRMRFPGWEQVKFVKGVPEGWEIVELEKIAKFTMGQSPKSEFYNEVGDGLPFHQGVGTYGERFPENKIFCSVSGRMANKGDILFSVRAPVGRLNIANCDLIIGRGLAAMRHKENKNSYFFYLLQNQFAKEDVIGNGAIFASVSKDELQKFKILTPAKHLIDKFDEIASKLDKQIENLYASNSKLTKSRNLLLSRLISGKLSVEALEIRFPPSMITQ